MTEGMIIKIVHDAVYTILLISAPILGVSMIVGLIISIFQATTSIQELTITFVPKVVAILLTIALFAGWIFTHMEEYTVHLFNEMIKIAR